MLSRRDHLLGHQEKKSKKTKIISSIFSDHNYKKSITKRGKKSTDVSLKTCYCTTIGQSRESKILNNSEMNKNGNMTCKCLCYTVKLVTWNLEVQSDK